MSKRYRINPEMEIEEKKPHPYIIADPIPTPEKYCLSMALFLAKTYIKILNFLFNPFMRFELYIKKGDEKK